MSKRSRHGQILEIIKHHRVSSQEGLREVLQSQGVDVTQATLSRDIRELRLVKVPDADGASRYSLPEEWESTPPLETLLPTLFVSAEGVGNFLVVRTMKGGAQAIALGIDWEEWPEVMGTLAGDDTILMIFRETSAVEAVRERLQQMAGNRE
ncbi:MAG TPA: arginine repressor [Longimicrobiales bacterium]|nr:arginine repressor [Longimicrobiales bacterium]